MVLAHKISRLKAPDIATKIGTRPAYKPVEAPSSKGTTWIIDCSFFLAHTSADAF